MENEQDRLTCGGFDVWIASGGKKATTYGLEHKEIGKHKQVSCWICSEAGKGFSVRFKRKNFSKFDYTATVLLDGHMVANYIYRNEGSRAISSNLRTRKISYSRTSPTEVRTFVFGSIELTDDDAYLDDPLAQNIGEIKVIIQAVENLGMSSDQTRTAYTIPPASKLHERLKKGSTHQIQFKPVHQNKCPAGALRFSQRTVGKQNIFLFKYRPLEMLQATGIAPRPVSTLDNQPSLYSKCPTNDPNEPDKVPSLKRELSDDEELLEEDADEMVAKAHALLAKAESARAKQRIKKDGAPVKKKVKANQ